MSCHQGSNYLKLTKLYTLQLQNQYNRQNLFKESLNKALLDCRENDLTQLNWKFSILFINMHRINYGLR